MIADAEFVQLSMVKLRREQPLDSMFGVPRAGQEKQ
jgi:hypothetical protein